MEAKTQNTEELKHGDEVTATFGSKTYKARVELRMVGHHPSTKEELYLCIPGRWPIPVKDWPGSIH